MPEGGWQMEAFGVPPGAGRGGPEAEAIVQQFLLRFGVDEQSINQALQNMGRLNDVIGQATGEKPRPGAAGGRPTSDELEKVNRGAGRLQGSFMQLIQLAGAGGGAWGMIRLFQSSFEHVANLRRGLIQVQAATGDNTLSLREYREEIRQVADSMGMTEREAETMLGALPEQFEQLEIFEGGLMRTAAIFEKVYGISNQTSVEMMRQLHKDLGMEVDNVSNMMFMLSGRATEANIHAVERFMSSVLDLATATRELGVEFGESTVLVEYFQKRVEGGRMTARFADEMTNTLARLGLQGDVGMQALLGQYMGQRTGMGDMGTAAAVMHFRDLPLFERLLGVRSWVGEQTRGAGTEPERRFMAEQLYEMFGMDWVKVAEFEQMSVDELRKLAVEAEITENMARERLNREDQYFTDTQIAWNETLAHQSRLEAYMADFREAMPLWKQAGEAWRRAPEDIMMAMGGAGGVMGAAVRPAGGMFVGPGGRMTMAPGVAAGAALSAPEFQAALHARRYYEQGEQLEIEINRTLRNYQISGAGSAAIAAARTTAGRGEGIQVGSMTLDFNITSPEQLRTGAALKNLIRDFIDKPEFLTKLSQFLLEHQRELEHAH